MRGYFVLACLAALTSLPPAQQPTPQPAMPTPFGQGRRSGDIPAESMLKDMFEAKIKTEWEALKNRDKKAYGDLLADDYEGVEVDGKGERTKLQALNELPEGNVANYTLWGLNVIPVGQEAALVTYEVTMQFPPKSATRLSRVYISELWIKRAGLWKEVHYQETRVK
jgi:hypothetical protein